MVAVLRSPFYAPRPSDDSVWQGRPVASAVLAQLLTVGGQVKSRQWLFGYDDPAIWQQPFQRNIVLITPPAATPLTYPPWRFGYSDDSNWEARPLRSSIIQLLTTGGQPPMPRFRYDFDVAETFWTGSPLRSPLLAQILTSAGQVKSRQWLFGYDDGANWRPDLHRNFQLLTAPVSTTPFIPVTWKFGYVDEPSWQLSSWRRSPILFPPLPPIQALAFSSDAPSNVATATDTARYICTANTCPSGQYWSGAGYMGKYEIDSAVELVGLFTDALANVYIDPTNITLYIMDPSGATSTQNYPGNVIRDSLGHFHYTFTPTKSGTWSYKWQATGTAIATSPDTTFTVNASTMIAG